MTTCLGKSCSFGLPRVPFVNCCQFMYLVISLLVLRAACGIWLYQFLIIDYPFTSLKLFFVKKNNSTIFHSRFHLFLCFVISENRWKDQSFEELKLSCYYRNEFYFCGWTRVCLNFGSAIMLVTYFVKFRQLNDHLFGKELFIRSAASAFRKLPSVYVFSYFPFDFEGRMWDLIVSVPDHCLSVYFVSMCKHWRITHIKTIAQKGFI